LALFFIVHRCLKAKEQEERETRLAKPAIWNLPRRSPSVHRYTTFPTADKHFAQYPIWQWVKIESEGRLIFEERIPELEQQKTVCIFSVGIT